MAGRFMNFVLDMPRVTEMRVFYDAAPGTVVRKVHHRIVARIAKETKSKMKLNIQRMFPLYSPSDRTRRGRRKRWQTPTGAMQNSVGIKTLKSNQMRSRGLAMAFVGARNDFRATKNVRRRVASLTNLGFQKAPNPIHTPQGPSGRTVAPVRYFHLAAFGHGPGPQGLGFHAVGHDFVSPTLTQMRSRMKGIINSEYPRAYQKVLETDARSVLRRIGRTKLQS